MLSELPGELQKYRALTIWIVIGITASVLVFVVSLSMAMNMLRGEVKVESHLAAQATKSNLTLAFNGVKSITNVALSRQIPAKEFGKRVLIAIAGAPVRKLYSDICIEYVGATNRGETQPCKVPDTAQKLDSSLSFPPALESAMYLDTSRAGPPVIVILAKTDHGIVMRFDIDINAALRPPKEFANQKLQENLAICFYIGIDLAKQDVVCRTGSESSIDIVHAENWVDNSSITNSYEFLFDNQHWQIKTGFDSSRSFAGVVRLPLIALMISLLATIAACRYVFVMTDARIKSEEQLRINHSLKELEKRNEDLEQFAYMASHDLQTPLRHIMSAAGMLEEDLDEGDYDCARKNAHTINTASERMQAFILDLLEFCRAGDVVPTLTRVNIRELLAQQVEMVRGSDPTHQFDVAIGPLPVLHTDAVKLAQVFQHFLTNAIKFSRNDIKLEIHVASRWRADLRRWEFSFRDNGIGIDEAHRKRIFLPFKRLHTNRKTSGTGIGLAVAKRLVEKLGGRIWVRSSANAGATFYFTLPNRGQTGTNERSTAQLTDNGDKDAA